MRARGLPRRVSLTGVEHWPAPTPFPVGDVNGWYLPGRVPTLIDPGPLTDAAWSTLAPRLRKHRVELVVFTHHHVDHAGLAARVHRETGAKVACQAEEAHVLAQWGERALEREHDYELGLMRAGVPVEQRERMRYGGRKIDTYGESVQV